jgi:hypothetical protein
MEKDRIGFAPGLLIRRGKVTYIIQYGYINQATASPIESYNYLLMSTNKFATSIKQ